MKLRITVHGTAYEVEVEVLDAGDGFPAAPLPKIAQPLTPLPGMTPAGIAPAAAAPVRPTNQSAGAAGSSDTVNSPIAGTVLEIKCRVGDRIERNQELLVIEAMKMETSIAAPAAGVVKSVDVAVGDAVREGQILVQFV
ncbi:biotin/lipoyl-binding protein [bacterium]|nr:biotin/lipoyl-binding protein [candidate division CSSED10-310 bacterium]